MSRVFLPMAMLLACDMPKYGGWPQEIVKLNDGRVLCCAVNWSHHILTCDDGIDVHNATNYETGGRCEVRR